MGYKQNKKNKNIIFITLIAIVCMEYYGYKTIIMPIKDNLDNKKMEFNQSERNKEEIKKVESNISSIKKEIAAIQNDIDKDTDLNQFNALDKLYELSIYCKKNGLSQVKISHEEIPYEKDEEVIKHVFNVEIIDTKYNIVKFIENIESSNIKDFSIESINISNGLVEKSEEESKDTDNKENTKNADSTKENTKKNTGNPAAEEKNPSTKKSDMSYIPSSSSNKYIVKLLSESGPPVRNIEEEYQSSTVQKDIKNTGKDDTLTNDVGKDGAPSTGNLYTSKIVLYKLVTSNSKVLPKINTPSPKKKNSFSDILY